MTGDVIADLAAGVRAGRPAAVGRAISLVERADPGLVALLSSLGEPASRSQVIGLTGPPGVGKSTTTAALIAAYRAAGTRVAVLAVDPSSARTGGALLGDRIRMREHATDPGVFIRSMASRGHLGGLALAAPAALRVLAAAGFPVILLETVGVGQSEIDVAELADTTVLIGAPGQGDAVQAAKSGVAEVADLFAINKADQPGADAAVREIRRNLSYAAHFFPPGAWNPLVVTTVSASGEVQALVTAIARHWRWLADSGRLARGRRLRVAREIEGLALGRVTAILAEAEVAGQVEAGAEELAEGRASLGEVVDRLTATLAQRLSR